MVFSRCFLRSVDVFDAIQIVTDNHDVFLSIYSFMKIYTYVCIQCNGNSQNSNVHMLCIVTPFFCWIEEIAIFFKACLAYTCLFFDVMLQFNMAIPGCRIVISEQRYSNPLEIIFSLWTTHDAHRNHQQPTFLPIWTGFAWAPKRDFAPEACWLAWD